jgi:hypothetical protein
MVANPPFRPAYSLTGSSMLGLRETACRVFTLMSRFYKTSKLAQAAVRVIATGLVDWLELRFEQPGQK